MKKLPKSLTTVTMLSKFLAGTLFVLLPFLGFYLGYRYHEAITMTTCVTTNCKTIPQTNQMANPASVNCEQKGGTLVIMKRPDGGEYGLCNFDDGRSCEEWAMFRNECPVGGVKTTGLDAIEEKYCVWSGGQTSSSDPNCTFIDNTFCVNTVLYKSECKKGDSNIKIFFHPAGNRLIKGKQITLKWSGGPSEITINLIDIELAKKSVSVSLVDGFDHIRNTGEYKYTIPKSLPTGIYRFSIGSALSETFLLSDSNVVLPQ